MIKRKRQHYQSLFVKSVAALILIGIVPLLIMGISIYSCLLYTSHFPVCASAAA